MKQSERIEIWKEIISSAENGDPGHSYRLFSEIMDSLINEKQTNSSIQAQRGKKAISNLRKRNT